MLERNIHTEGNEKSRSNKFEFFDQRHKYQFKVVSSEERRLTTRPDQLFKYTPRSRNGEKSDDEILSLKQQINGLRTKYDCLERQMINILRQTDKSKKNLFETFYQDDKKKCPQSLLYDLKKQIKEMRAELDLKTHTLVRLQKEQLCSNVKEIQIEAELYRLETVRLRSMLVRLLSINNLMDENQINLNTIKNDNIEMSVMIYNLQVKEKQNTQTIKDLNHSNNKLSICLQQNKKQINLLEKDVDELKIKDPYLLFRKQGNNHTIDKQRAEIEQKSIELSHLTNSFMLKDKKISDLERRIKEIQLESTLMQDKYNKDTRMLKEQLQNKEIELNHSQTMIPVAPQRRVSQNAHIFKTVSIEEQAKRMSNLQEHIQEQNEESSDGERKTPTVKKEHVHSLCKSMRFKLIKLNISMKQLDEFLFQQEDIEAYEDHEDINIFSLKEVMQKFPFNLNADDSVKLARYLVDDDETPLVVVDLDMVSSVPRVRSVLRNLLENYELFHDKQLLTQQISPHITKFRSTILDHIKQQKMSRNQNKMNYCLEGDFFSALKLVDIQLTNRQLEFIQQINYEISNNQDQFLYLEILEYFTSL